MIRCYFVLCILLLIINHSYSQVVDTLNWKNDVELKWSDFRGAIPLNVVKGIATEIPIDAVAATTASIDVQWELKNGDLPNFCVTTSFHRNLSWVSDTTLVSYLNHEQLHFDIAGLIGLKVKLSLDSLRLFEEKNIKIYFSVVDFYQNMVDSLQVKYDFETNHGMIFDEQLRWNEMINSQIDSLLLPH